MKLLLISPYPLFPDKMGGKIRTVQLARNLCELGVDVTVATPFHYTQKRALYQDEKFKLVEIKYPFIIPFLFTDRPFPYTYLSSLHPYLSCFFKRFLSEFDIYQFEHAQFANLIDSIEKPGIVVYDAHNVEYDYTRHECIGPWIKKVAGQRIQILENKLVRKADHIFAVSHSDAQRLSELYNANPQKTTIAPNGMKDLVDLTGGDAQRVRQRFPCIDHFPRRAVYSGSNVQHNRMAVQFILENLAPHLSKYAFIIHGKCGYPFRNTSIPNVFFDLEDANFRDYTTLGAVALNPISQGSGSNLKILNYLSHGMPTLSTPFGLRGYEDLRAYVMTVELGEFPDLLRKGEFAHPPPPQFLAEKYSWRIIGDGMLQIYHQLIPHSKNTHSISF